MGNQIVTSEIKEWFHARFAQILEIIRIWTKTQGKLFPNFFQFTIWLPINNVMGDELR